MQVSRVWMGATEGLPPITGWLVLSRFKGELVLRAQSCALFAAKRLVIDFLNCK